MTKYTFSQGKVIAEEGVYVPAIRKDRRLSRTGMLIVIRPQDAEGQRESTIAMDKEKAKVDKDMCVDCETCVDVCPSEAIHME